MIILVAAILFFIILRFVVTLFNFISDPKLRRVTRHYQDKVSILVPVRNEADNILTLLESITQQDYPNYEVIILDDDSTDDTYTICLGFVAQYPKFKILKGKKLPAGWLGKNYACHQLAAAATGDYLLFLDADEQVRLGLINSAVHRMKVNRLGLLSLFTNQTMLSFGEQVIVPLMHYILLNLLPLRLVFLTKNKSVAAASGQFMLFDAESYRENLWHQQVKENVVEDVEIMRLVKASGFNGESLLANGMINCRMYRSYHDAVNGFSKNFLAAFNYSIPGFVIYMLLLIAGPVMVLAFANFALKGLMVSLIILTRIMISFSAGQNALRNVLLHPLQMLGMLHVAVLSIKKHLTKTTVWKGRKI